MAKTTHDSITTAGRRLAGGLIAGCLISASVQIYSFVRNTTSQRTMEAMPWQPEPAST